MNQAVFFHFAIQKQERIYQFIVQPGSPWEEVESVLEDFKKDFNELREKLAAEEAAKKESQPAVNNVVSPG
jgi:hypothetical protein